MLKRLLLCLALASSLAVGSEGKKELYPFIPSGNELLRGKIYLVKNLKRDQIIVMLTFFTNDKKLSADGES